MKINITPAKGKLGILIPGLGAVATTLIAGVEAVKKGISQPIGSLTQMGHIRLGKRTENRNPKIKEFVPLADLNDIVFGGWDVYEDNVFEAASNAQVLEAGLLHSVKAELEAIKPMKAAFDKNYAKNLDGTHVKTGTRLELAEQVMEDIKNFKEANGLDRVVLVWCGSTEIYYEASAVHQSLAAFEEGLKNDDKLIAPSMIYAYAALKLGVPFANGAPNLTVDIPALIELAKLTKTPIAGKDFKTGQTLMKTVLAPGLAARSLGVHGWFSTNILGNRDGWVLDDPDNFKTKEVSKLGVLEDIFKPEDNQELYGNIYHKIRINYYPPHGDNKESWDNIDIFGWLGYKMQIKINFLCRDSILAAPIALDLAIFCDLAKRAGMSGIQEWLSFYLKSPQTAPGLHAENDIFKQLIKLENTLRYLMGEDLITHLGLDYYDDMFATE
ncbi:MULTISPECIES: inositol-3-phosphate synthase [Mucilaginibacter]|jgi:myo-inositol-1-phosphate synthase|uniref:Inositol-3-phosphate synthase n=2 Tax=Mucilaginibacter TaxID=423349 RepID=A0AAE6MGV6_9SPHI|nr:MULTISPECIES: inositol-3-phosphate synthase [Mucilaginibacter]NVM65886.1 myo-inositol-1-phosphate synthase [Mucilaginibacter sp. SG538B]QEM02823.1 inositol-3-phosphate synthase [Mucilaginibacter rubeus]QEM15441.1 inositol-3-phosphate synthase [Mucilaginibacter gossypii]QTE39545.1 inositol-3-phosphate synthase [Mucilaginibacter gossypii]QTE41829.1 inositol-3-phosphate synthase [Mucilaginibacter rubeus]